MQSQNIDEMFMKYYNNHEEGVKFVIIALHRIACLNIMYYIRNNIKQWLSVDLKNSLKNNQYELQFSNFHIVARSLLHTYNETTTNKNDVFVTLNS